MGLRKNHKTSSGLNINNAYYRVTSLESDHKVTRFFLAVYVSRDEFLMGRGALELENHLFNPDVSDDAPNFFRQAYAYLKSIDNYEDAVDVLEEGQTPLAA